MRASYKQVTPLGLQEERLRLSDGSRVAGEVLVDAAELAILRMPRAIGVVAQGQVIREAAAEGSAIRFDTPGKGEVS